MHGKGKLEETHMCTFPHETSLAGGKNTPYIKGDDVKHKDDIYNWIRNRNLNTQRLMQTRVNRIKGTRAKQRKQMNTGEHIGK